MPFNDSSHRRAFYSPHVDGLWLSREAAVAGKVDHHGSVGRKFPVAGSDEDEELRHRRLVQQILVRVLALQNDAAIFLDGQKNCFKNRKVLFSQFFAY